MCVRVLPHMAVVDIESARTRWNELEAIIMIAGEVPFAYVTKAVSSFLKAFVRVDSDVLSAISLFITPLAAGYLPDIKTAR